VSAPRGPIDWPAARARLDAVRRALDAGNARSPEATAVILARRAATLAAPRPEAAAPSDVVELLVLEVARGRYGVETQHVREVLALDGLTRVPAAPGFVLGIVNHRGRILPVLDLGSLFGLTREGGGERPRVVAVEAGGMTFGLMADSVVGVTRVGAGELRSPPTPPGEGEPFVRSVTGDLVAVLALDALARRIVVDDEGGRAALQRGEVR